MAQLDGLEVVFSGRLMLSALAALETGISQFAQTFSFINALLPLKLTTA